MTTLALQCAIVVLLILLNGLFAMSETALVSAPKAGLRQRADAGDNRTRSALELANSATTSSAVIRYTSAWSVFTAFATPPSPLLTLSVR
jgi:CBS domain containing-hemolysin-like protein